MDDLRRQVERLRADLQSIERRLGQLERALDVASPETGAAPEAAGLGKRRSIRKKGLLRTDYGTGSAFFSGIATDVSETGMCLETSRRHEVGMQLDLVFELPKSDRPLKIRGEIARVSESGQDIGGATQYSVGLRFLSMDILTRSRLKHFIATLPAEKRPEGFDEKDKSSWLTKLNESGL
jgi:hypothetical protein